MKNKKKNDIKNEIAIFQPNGINKKPPNIKFFEFVDKATEELKEATEKFLKENKTK